MKGAFCCSTICELPCCIEQIGCRCFDRIPCHHDVVLTTLATNEWRKVDGFVCWLVSVSVIWSTVCIVLRYIHSQVPAYNISPASPLLAHTAHSHILIFLLTFIHTSLAVSYLSLTFVLPFGLWFPHLITFVYIYRLVPSPLTGHPNSSTTFVSPNKKHSLPSPYTVREKINQSNI